MNALTHGNQLERLEALQHGLGSLFTPSPVHDPEGRAKPLAVPRWAPMVDIHEDDREYRLTAELPEVKNEDGKVSAEFKDRVLTVHLTKKHESLPQPERVVDEITAWWQKALGTNAVLGQASNRPPPEPSAPTVTLVWTKAEREQVQSEVKIVEATSKVTESNGPHPPGTQAQRGHTRGDRSLTAVGSLKDRSGAMVNGAVVFLAIALLRLAGGIFLAIRAAVDSLIMEFRRIARWPRSVRGFFSGA